MHVLDGGACQVGIESTVIDMTVYPPKLLRPGAVTWEQLQQVLGTVEIDPAVCHPLAKGKAASSPGMKYKHYAPQLGSFCWMAAMSNIVIISMPMLRHMLQPCVIKEKDKGCR